MKCVRDLQVLMKCPLLCSRYVYTCNMLQERKKCMCAAKAAVTASRANKQTQRCVANLNCACANAAHAQPKWQAMQRSPKIAKCKKKNKKYCKSKCAIFSSLLFLQWHKPHYSQLIAHAQRRVAYWRNKWTNATATTTCVSGKNCLKVIRIIAAFRQLPAVGTFAWHSCTVATVGAYALEMRNE